MSHSHSSDIGYESQPAKSSYILLFYTASVARSAHSVITIRLWAGRLGFGSRLNQEILIHSVLTGSVAHPVSYPMGTASIPEVMRQGREADHSPLSSAEMKNGRGIPPFPHMPSWHSA
jgi:hypothetical protein